MVVDYNEIMYNKARELKLSINKQPPAIKQIILEPKKVNFLIRILFRLDKAFLLESVTFGVIIAAFGE